VFQSGNRPLTVRSGLDWPEEGSRPINPIVFLCAPRHSGPIIFQGDHFHGEPSAAPCQHGKTGMRRSSLGAPDLRVPSIARPADAPRIDNQTPVRSARHVLDMTVTTEHDPGAGAAQSCRKHALAGRCERALQTLLKQTFRIIAWASMHGEDGLADLEMGRKPAQLAPLLLRQGISGKCHGSGSMRRGRLAEPPIMFSANGRKPQRIKQF